jgi:hypothetical protein
MELAEARAEKMSLRSNVDRQRRKIIREDRKHLEACARSFLSDYLRATEAEKELYYDAVSGASAGCRPSNAVSHLDSKQMAEETANVASRVAKQRQRNAQYNRDGREKLITDAYATTAIAYRRAAGTYVDDEEMLKLGTAAVHLLTMATSRLMAQAKD